MLPLASPPGSSLGFLHPHDAYLDFIFPVNLKFSVQTSNIQTQQLGHKHHIKIAGCFPANIRDMSEPKIFHISLFEFKNEVFRLT